MSGAPGIVTWAKDRDYVLLAPLTYELGKPDTGPVEALPVQAMKAASDWAENQAGSIAYICKPPRRGQLRC